ncbi:MAG TPA: condensation domain-containing protein, partial [Thermoanaerobaculia bacterium]|nr:condensation domain-containing protein [Thermoanaerobaculia bacterium]
MSELAKRLESLSPEKRELLQLLRSDRARRPGPEPVPARARRTAPFALVSEEDRARLPAGAEDAYPLTLIQLGMLHQMELTRDEPVPAYHNVNSFHIRGAFSPRPLQEAVDRVVARHPVLRTSFQREGFGEPLQVVHRWARLEVAVEDLRALEEGEQRRRLEAFLAAENRNLLDLESAPLVRLRVHRWSDDRFSLTLTEPHALSDGWSTAATLREIFELYLALGRGEEPPPQKPLQTSFRDHVALEREALASAETRRFWQAEVEREAVGRLARTKAVDAAGAAGDRKPEVWFPEEVVEGLHRLSRRTGLPLKSVLLAAHLKVVSLFTGSASVVTGLTSHGRPESVDGEQVRGLFLNTLPFAFDLAGCPWEELARRVFEVEGRVWPHRRFPLPEIQRLAGRRVLFDSAFSFLHFHSLLPLLDSGEGERIQDGSSDLSVTDFPLMATFTLRPAATSRLRLTLEHDPKALDPVQAAQMRDCYVRVLAALAADPSASHDAVPLIAPRDESFLLGEWKGGTAEFPREPSVQHRFQEAAARRPDAVALTGAGIHLSYGELRARAALVARALRRLGVRPEELVALYLERGPQVPVSILGALEAGSAYLPIDPIHPPERVAFVIGDARPRAVITERGLVSALPRLGGLPVLLLEDLLDGGEAGGEPPRAEPSRLSPEALAYVIYTSGSTGRPKGVALSHGAVARLFAASEPWFGFGPEDAWTLFHSHAFDFSVWEL